MRSQAHGTRTGRPNEGSGLVEGLRAPLQRWSGRAPLWRVPQAPAGPALPSWCGQGGPGQPPFSLPFSGTTPDVATPLLCLALFSPLSPPHKGRPSLLMASARRGRALELQPLRSEGSGPSPHLPGAASVGLAWIRHLALVQLAVGEWGRGMPGVRPTEPWVDESQGRGWGWAVMPPPLTPSTPPPPPLRAPCWPGGQCGC